METNWPSFDGLSIRDLQQEEYETALFGFSARSVLEGVENIVPEVITNASNSLKDCLAQKFNSNSQLEKISLATDELIKNCKASAVTPLHELKTVVDGYFHIPSNVLLPEDRVQCTQYSEEEIEKLNEEIKDLKVRAKRAFLMEAILEDEIHRAFKLGDMGESQYVKSILTKGNDDKQLMETVPVKFQQLGEAISILNHEKNNVLLKH